MLFNDFHRLLLNITKNYSKFDFYCDNHFLCAISDAFQNNNLTYISIKIKQTIVIGLPIRPEEHNNDTNYNIDDENIRAMLMNINVFFIVLKD